MWNPFRRSETRKKTSITELTADERQEIEAGTEAGLKPSDIADGLGLDPVLVWNYRKGLKAKAALQPLDTVKSAMADLQATKLQAQIAEIQQRMALDRAEFKADMRDAQDDDGGEMAWIKEILPMFMRPPQGSPAPLPNSPTPSGGGNAPALSAPVHMSDEEIDRILGALPAIARRAIAKMSDDQLLGQIRAYYPTADDDTVQRAIKRARL